MTRPELFPPFAFSNSFLIESLASEDKVPCGTLTTLVGLSAPFKVDRESLFASFCCPISLVRDSSGEWPTKLWSVSTP